MTRYAESIGPARRAQAVRLATASYLRSHRLWDAEFRVIAEGYGVAISLPAADACTIAGRIAAAPAFARELRDALGFLRIVTIHAVGDRGSLRSYLRRRCPHLTRVFQRTGRGPFTSRVVDVPQGRWAVLLATRRGGAQLEAVGASPGARTVATLTLTEPGVTSRTIAVGGRFRLRVRGSGGWTVAVLRSAP